MSDKEKTVEQLQNELNAAKAALVDLLPKPEPKKEPYTKEDKPNPLNKYGLSKLKGEEAVIKNCKKYYIARTSWLYGHHGKNFIETMISLAEKPELKVVNDQIGSPTWTIELANGIVNLLNNKADYGIYHISGSGNCRCRAGDSLEAYISGSGNVTYSGNPKVDAKVSGSGHVRSK